MKTENTEVKSNTKPSKMGVFRVIARFLFGRWTKWELIYIYNFSLTNRSIEVRKNLYNGKIQFRVRKIAHPVHAKYFDAEDVKRALANVPNSLAMCSADLE